MAEFEFRAGAKLEVVTPGEMSSLLSKHAKTVLRGEAEIASRRPTGRPIQGKGTMPASGSLVIDCGGPPPGRTWDVKRYALTGQDPTASIAGVTSAVAMIGNAANPTDPFALIDRTTTLPLVSTWGDDQAVVHPGETLYFVIAAGPAAATVIFATGWALERLATQEQTPEPMFEAEGRVVPAASLTDALGPLIGNGSA